MLILGDSHARRWGEYEAALGAPLFGGWAVTYAGYSGETSLQVEGRLPAALADGWDVVVLMVGTNDVWFIDSPTTAALLRMVAAVTAAGAAPVVWKIPQITVTDRIPPSGSMSVAAWNAAVSGANVLDGYTISLAGGTMLDDGLHLSAEGYRQITDALRALIAPLA